MLKMSIQEKTCRNQKKSGRKAITKDNFQTLLRKKIN